MDEDALVTLVRDFARSDPGASRTPFVHSVLIARHGKLVLEEYFFGFDATRPHDLRSGSKTFASLMVGAAMETGAQLSVDTPVLSLLGVDDPVPHADDRKRRITVGHLMTHSSGVACDDNDDDSPGNEGVMQSQDREPDWYRYALNLPMMHDPGTRYAYCTAGMNPSGPRM